MADMKNLYIVDVRTKLVELYSLYFKKILRKKDNKFKTNSSQKGNSQWNL